MINRLDELITLLISLKNQPGAIYLYPHTGIDGDALGSSLALLMVLRKAGVNARFLYDEVIPAKYAFLPGIDLIEPFEKNSAVVHADEQLLAIAVDCSDSARTGRRRELFDRAPQSAVIDHHISESECAPLGLIDPTAAATGELIYKVIELISKKTGRPMLDQQMAVLLMTALITDTGRFTFSNTSEQTFSIASHLMVFKMDIREIVYRMFDMTSQSRLRLTGRVFSEATFHLDGKIVIACVDQGMLDQFGAVDSDLDGLVGQLRNVQGVELSFIIREVDQGILRINIRSSELFDAARFARTLGGGGHARAAGAQLKNMTMQDAADMLVQKAGELL